nr:hypothetical protein CFP56_48136 [Quercus suber]
MEPILQLYVDGANLQCGADNIQLFLAEVKLAWIVHIVAAILKTLQISGQTVGGLHSQSVMCVVAEL